MGHHLVDATRMGLIIRKFDHHWLIQMEPTDELLKWLSRMGVAHRDDEVGLNALGYVVEGASPYWEIDVDGIFIRCTRRPKRLEESEELIKWLRLLFSKPDYYRRI